MLKNGKLILLLLIFVLCFLGAGENQLSASTILTPERVSIQQLASALNVAKKMGTYGEMNNWESVSKVFKTQEANHNLADRQSYPLEKHYQFVKQTIAVPNDPQSKVLLIRTVPLANFYDEPDPKKQRRWRYLIYQKGNGEIEFKRMPEEEIQKMLAVANAKIIPDPSLPLLETDTTPPPKPSSTPDNFTPIPDRNTPDLATQSASKHSPSITPETKSQTQPSSSVPLVVGILLLLAGAGFLFYRRKP